MIVKAMAICAIIVITLLIHYVIVPRIKKEMDKKKIKKIKAQKKGKKALPPPLVYKDFESIRRWLEEERKRRKEDDGDFNPSER